MGVNLNANCIQISAGFDPDDTPAVYFTFLCPMFTAVQSAPIAIRLSAMTTALIAFSSPSEIQHQSRAAVLNGPSSMSQVHQSQHGDMLFMQCCAICIFTFYFFSVKYFLQTKNTAAICKSSRGSLFFIFPLELALFSNVCGDQWCSSYCQKSRCHSQSTLQCW